MIAHTIWERKMHKSKSSKQKRFVLLDMYADSGQGSNPEAWRKHGLHTYDPTDTALILDISLSTLRRWRLAKKGPLPVRRKGKLHYRFCDIYAFLAEEAERVGYILQPFPRIADLLGDKAKTTAREKNQVEGNREQQVGAGGQLTA